MIAALTNIEAGPSPDVELTLMKSQRLISPLTGIIRTVEEIPLNAEDAAQVSLFISSLADASKFSVPLSNRWHGATALTKAEGRVKAIGEAVERYCAAFVDPDAMSFGSFREVSGRAIHPASFALYSRRQHSRKRFPYPAFHESTRVGWVKGYSLTREDEVLVPASLTYLPYYPRFKGEEILSPAISTGLACRGTFEEAALTAICEVVERDACMIMWLNRLSMPRVVFDGDRLSSLFQRSFGHPSITVHLIDVTNDVGIPAFMALTLSPIDGRQAVTAGACSHLSPLTAALKAVTESINSGTILQVKMRENPDWTYNSDFSNIRDFVDHAFLYYQPEMFRRLQFAWSAPTTVGLSGLPDLFTGNPKEDLRSCVRMLEERGLETVIVDLTTEDIASAGFRVVRALIPGMIGLNADHRLGFLGGPRLYSAPARMGYRSMNTTEDDLNPYPHPFQ